MKKYTVSVIVALAATFATATADEFGIGVPLFSYRTSTPVGGPPQVQAPYIPQSQLPVYNPAQGQQGQAAPAAPAAPTAPTAPVPVLFAQPDGTVKLVHLAPANVVVAPPAVKRKEILIRPGITFFRTREW